MIVVGVDVIGSMFFCFLKGWSGTCKVGFKEGIRYLCPTSRVSTMVMAARFALRRESGIFVLSKVYDGMYKVRFKEGIRYTSSSRGLRLVSYKVQL